jgi:hypothetical protein
MRSEIVTKLPLATWAKILGLHPLHFAQVQFGEISPHCNEIYFQHEWQNSDHVSREEIARAIAEAEAKIERALGYHLVPTWDVDEWRDTTRSFRKELVNINGADIRGYRQIVQANWGYFISGGIQSKELIEADAAITYSDPDDDGYFQVATVSVATLITDTDEIAVYYPGHAGDDAWEIKPIEVSLSGGIATITFRRELAIQESFYDLMNVEDGGAADGADDDDFLEEVDVYRRYNDPQSQASFLWEPLAGSCASCHGNGCPTCAYAIQTGCLVLRGDPRQSLIGYWPASWDNDNLDFTGQPWSIARLPDIVRLFYYSGWRNKTQRYVSRMDADFERTVAYMAAAMLDRPPCACVKGQWDKWRKDLALTAGDEDGNAIYRTARTRYELLDNPFGTRYGEIYAWRKVRDQSIGHAV